MSTHLRSLRAIAACAAAVAIQFLLVAVAAACTGGGTWPSRWLSGGL